MPNYDAVEKAKGRWGGENVSKSDYLILVYSLINIDLEMLSHLKRASFRVARSHRALMFSLVLYIQYEKVHRPVRHGYAA